MIAMRRSAALRGLWPAMIGLCVAGCFGASRVPPPIRQFRLTYEATAPQGAPLPYVLRVAPMEVSAAYDRDPIVYRESDYNIGSYFYFRWASNPGSMVADLLARDLASSGLYRDVQTAVSVVPPDYQIKGTVEEIEEVVSLASCSAHLTLRITLSATRGPREERVRLAKLYTADDPCRCDDPESIAASMSRAMAQISAAVQADIYAAIKPDADAAGRH